MLRAIILLFALLCSPSLAARPDSLGQLIQENNEPATPGRRLRANAVADKRRAYVAHVEGDRQLKGIKKGKSKSPKGKGASKTKGSKGPKGKGKGSKSKGTPIKKPAPKPTVPKPNPKPKPMPKPKPEKKKKASPDKDKKDKDKKKSKDEILGRLSGWK